MCNSIRFSRVNMFRSVRSTVNDNLFIFYVFSLYFHFAQRWAAYRMHPCTADIWSTYTDWLHYWLIWFDCKCSAEIVVSFFCIHPPQADPFMVHYTLLFMRWLVMRLRHAFCAFFFLRIFIRLMLLLSTLLAFFFNRYRYLRIYRIETQENWTWTLSIKMKRRKLWWTHLPYIGLFVHGFCVVCGRRSMDLCLIFVISVHNFFLVLPKRHHRSTSTSAQWTIFLFFLRGFYYLYSFISWGIKITL